MGLLKKILHPNPKKNIGEMTISQQGQEDLEKMFSQPKENWTKLLFTGVNPTAGRKKADWTGRGGAPVSILSSPLKYFDSSLNSLILFLA